MNHDTVALQPLPDPQKLLAGAPPPCKAKVPDGVWEARGVGHLSCLGDRGSALRPPLHGGRSSGSYGIFTALIAFATCVQLAVVVPAMPLVTLAVQACFSAVASVE